MTGDTAHDSDTGRKRISGDEGHARVTAAITAALAAGEPVTVSGIASRAGVQRRFIQRRPDLRELIRWHEEGGSNYGKPRPVRLPPAVEALIEQQLGDDGTWGRWLRDAAVEKLARDTGTDPDELDTARRPAQRRRNYSERQQDGKR